MSGSGHAELARVQRERDELAAQVKSVRVTLCSLGYCGDGHLPDLIERAVVQSHQEGVDAISDVDYILKAASNAFPPEMEGTLAERATQLTRERDEARAERDAMIESYRKHCAWVESQRDALASRCAAMEQVVEVAVKNWRGEQPRWAGAADVMLSEAVQAYLATLAPKGGG